MCTSAQVCVQVSAEAWANMNVHSVFMEASTRVMYNQLHVCICACLCLHRSHVWQQVYVRQSVNVCICVGMCMCMDIQLCAHIHSHMECLNVPEVINSLTWHYSAGRIHFAGCPSLTALIILPNKDWHISSKRSVANNFKVEEELMMPTVLLMFKSISWGDNYKLIMKLLSDSCICNFH